MVPCLTTAGCAYFYPKIYYVSCFKTKNYQDLDVGVPMTIRVSTEIGQNVKFHYPQTIPNRCVYSVHWFNPFTIRANCHSFGYTYPIWGCVKSYMFFFELLFGD